MKNLALCASIFGVVALGIGCGDDSGSGAGGSGGAGGAAGAGGSGGTASIYAALENWLCHPDITTSDNVCLDDLDATIVNADGSTSIERHDRAADPAFDCFYVYPTASGDQTGNSDLIRGDEEVFTTRNQAARYTQHCRVFAPLYRQVTIPALFNQEIERDGELAYGDVLDAFQYYLENDNEGRGFLLIGHSQGSGHLRRLIAEEIESDATLAGRMIAAHLLGTTVAVPDDTDVGGSFTSTPLCSSADQTGCVVSYASFRADEPPLAESSLFARTSDSETKAACVNPIVLNNAAPRARPYFPVEINAGLLGAAFLNPPGPFTDPERISEIATPYFIMPDFIEVECVDDGEFNYLSVIVLADEMDPRADEINGDLTEGWGLHLVDMTLLMGDLVDLANSQAQAWLAANP